MRTEHLSADQLLELVEQARGEAELEGSSTLDRDALVHLASCTRCQELVEQAGSVLDCVDDEPDVPAAAESGPGRDAGIPEQSLDPLADYIVVDFEPCELRRGHLAAARPRIAADHQGLAAIGPSRDRGHALHSTDDQLTIDVREDVRDDCCYLYLDPAPTLDLERIRLFVPPGIVVTYPIDTGYLRYPRYLYDIVSWTDIKLLYPRAPRA